MPRKHIPKTTETNLFELSKRRCCYCFVLENDNSEKEGQIAHIDQDNENPSLENLAWLCQSHHNKYDSTFRQTKGYTSSELKRYREKLYNFNRIRTDKLEASSCSKRLIEIVIGKNYEDFTDENMEALLRAVNRSQSGDENVRFLVKFEGSVVVVIETTEAEAIELVEYGRTEKFLEHGVIEVNLVGPKIPAPFSWFQPMQTAYKYAHRNHQNVASSVLATICGVMILGLIGVWFSGDSSSRLHMGKRHLSPDRPTTIRVWPEDVSTRNGYDVTLEFQGVWEERLFAFPITSDGIPEEKLENLDMLKSAYLAIVVRQNGIDEVQPEILALQELKKNKPIWEALSDQISRELPELFSSKRYFIEQIVVSKGQEIRLSLNSSALPIVIILIPIDDNYEDNSVNGRDGLTVDYYIEEHNN